MTLLITYLPRGKGSGLKEQPGQKVASLVVVQVAVRPGMSVRTAGMPGDALVP